MRAYTTEEWVILARGVHGEEYDYSKVDYKDTYTDVEVVCPEPGHGSFLVQPKQHIGPREKGCPICKPSGRRVIDTSVFTEDAMAVHGDKYDYSKVDYKNNHAKCEIICPEPGHGSFHLSYRSHIRNRKGCPTCEVVSKAEKRSGTMRRWKGGEYDARHPERTSFLDDEVEDAQAPIDPPSVWWPRRGKLAVKEYHRACDYSMSDPKGALNKCRIVAEYYVGDLHAKEIGEPNEFEELEKMMNRLRDTGKLDPVTKVFVNGIREMGNYGSHGKISREPTYDQVKVTIRQAEIILSEWLDGFEPNDPSDY